MNPVYVINLKDATERWRNVSAQLDRLGVDYERIEAVNGQLLTDDEIKYYRKPCNFFRWSYDLTPGEIGCHLSHLKIWRMIVDSGVSGAFVFEDDFQANDNLLNAMEAAQTHATGKVMVKLFRNAMNTGVYDVIASFDGGDLITVCWVPYWTLAYYITRDAAQELLLKREGKRLRRPVDDDLRYRWETGVNIWLVNPNPVRHADGHERTSSISVERNALPRRSYWKRKRLRWEWRYDRYRNKWYLWRTQGLGLFKRVRLERQIGS